MLLMLPTECAKTKQTTDSKRQFPVARAQPDQVTPPEASEPTNYRKETKQPTPTECLPHKQGIAVTPTKHKMKQGK